MLFRSGKPNDWGQTLRVAALQDTVTATVRPMLLILLAAVGMILLLAAVNLGTLVLGRSIERTREMAVRVALGASRRRVLGTIQSDVVKLVIPGVAIGLLLAIALVRLVVPWRGLSGAVMEPVIYILAAGVAVAVALLAGLPPARRAALVEPMIAMRSE